MKSTDDAYSKIDKEIDLQFKELPKDRRGWYDTVMTLNLDTFIEVMKAKIKRTEQRLEHIKRRYPNDDDPYYGIGNPPLTNTMLYGNRRHFAIDNTLPDGAVKLVETPDGFFDS